MSIANLLQPNTYNMYCNTLRNSEPIYVAVQTTGNTAINTTAAGNAGNPIANLQQLSQSDIPAFTVNAGNITCNMDGFYLILFTANWASNIAGTAYRRIAINVGANEKAFQTAISLNNDNNTNVGMSLSLFTALGPGDVLTFPVGQYSAAVAVNLLQNETKIYIVRV